MQKIKIGILGAGSFVQRRILPILSEVPTLECVSLFKRDLKEAQKVASEYKIPKVASSREELIYDPEVEAIYIATPNHLHEEDAHICAKAGKSVLCEKPLAPTVEAILRMQESFQKFKAQLFVGQSLRFKPSVQKSRALIAEGTLGDILHIRAFFALSVPKTNWRFQKNSGGGVLQDIGVHLIDLIRFVTQEEISVVYAQSDVENIEKCESSVTAVGKLVSGLSFTIECSLDQPLRSGFEIVGTKARLVSAGSLRQTYDPGETLCLIYSDDTVTYLPLRASNIYQAELAHFSKILLGEEVSKINSEEGLQNQIVIEALYKSIKEKVPQEVSLTICK